MKNGAWCTLVFAITLAAMFLLDLPLWVFLLVVCPVLVLVLTILSFFYSFRSSLEFGPVPPSGYESRLRLLDQVCAGLTPLGFEKVDGFYAKMVPDAVIYLFRHRADPVIGCLYHMGPKIALDMISLFEGGISLTTCSLVEGATVPRPTHALMEVENSSDFSRIFAVHLASRQYLLRQGHTGRSLPVAEYRPLLRRSIAEFRAYIQSLPLWPVRILWWTITKRGLRYCRPLEEQVRLGITKLPPPPAPAPPSAGPTPEVAEA